ncbi:MAG: acyltransferase [Burkholderiales bacterium]|nr:acyltransferase [Burkholderiales bacterium]
MATKSKYLNILNFMRFLAAVLIMGYHFVWTHTEEFALHGMVINSVLHHIFAFGKLGVPFFFIISGVVIMQSSVNRDWKSFILLRLLRVMPVYWLGVILVIICFLVFPKEILFFEPILKDVTNIFFHGDWYMRIIDMMNQYLLQFIRVPLQIIFPNLHLESLLWVGQAWSLREELKFYFIIMVMLTLFTKIESKIFWLLPISAVLYFTLHANIVGYPWCEYILMGIAIYLYRERGGGFWLAVLILQTLFTVYVERNYYFEHQDSVINPFSFALGDVLAIELIFLCGFFIFITHYPKFDQFFAKKIFRNLGAWSYPIFALHEYPGLFFIQYMHDKFNLDINILIIGTMCLIIVIAAFADNYFDRPIQKIGKTFLHKYFAVK